MREIVKEVYCVTKEFPHEERGYNGIVSQLRRASTSMVSNLAEGSSRKEREMLHFLSMSLGSLREVEAQLQISFDVGFLDKKSYLFVSELIDECSGRLVNYMKKVNSSLSDNE